MKKDFTLTEEVHYLLRKENLINDYTNCLGVTIRNKINVNELFYIYKLNQYSYIQFLDSAF